MRAPRVPVEEQYRMIMECRKSGLSDHQEVVKIEMNSISVPTDINKNTDTAAMELMIGNMNLRISNETDPLFLPKQSRYLRSFMLYSRCNGRKYKVCKGCCPGGIYSKQLCFRNSCCLGNVSEVRKCNATYRPLPLHGNKGKIQCS